MNSLKDKYIPDLPVGNLVEVSYALGTIYGTNIVLLLFGRLRLYVSLMEWRDFKVLWLKMEIVQQ